MNHKISVTAPCGQLLLAFLLALALAGCEHSYPEERIFESLKEICRKEYGVDQVEAKIVGKTMGVYLPLEKIFHTDFEEILAGGKVKDISSLLQISPEALDKVEDVLFSTSRVILSTDKPIDFYVLKATDTALTGITLILVGYVQDIKRVRFWDIPRSEYRRRVYHDLKVNYPVVWKRPVAGVFSQLGKESTREILDAYFLPGANLETISPLFYSIILEAQLKDQINIEILKLRSTGGRANEALVYVKVREDYIPKREYTDHKFTLPSRFEAEYIFVLTKYLGDFRISRVIPFHYVDEFGNVKKVDFPPELQLYENVDQWQEEFELEEIKLEKFLAQQISRRVQPILAEDERIQNTFASKKVYFTHEPMDPEARNRGYFLLHANLMLKKPVPMDYPGAASETWKAGKGKASKGLEAVVQDEEALKDIYYLMDKVFRECVTVLRGYLYDTYEYLKIDSLFGAPFVIKKPDLELFRKKKVDVVELLARSAVALPF